MYYIVSLFKGMNDMETGSEAGSSQDLPPSANQPTRSEPADDPAAVVEHDGPTDEGVGFSTCTTYESCPDSPSLDRYITKYITKL